MTNKEPKLTSQVLASSEKKSMGTDGMALVSSP